MRFRMLTMTPKKIAEICGGTYYGDRDLATKEITGVVCKNKSLVSLKYSISAWEESGGTIPLKIRSA